MVREVIAAGVLPWRRIGNLTRRLVSSEPSVPHGIAITDIPPRLSAAPPPPPARHWYAARHAMLATIGMVGILSLTACHRSDFSANHVESRIGGDTVFPTAHQMIHGAQHSVHLEMFEIGTRHVDGKVGAPNSPGFAEQQQIVDDLVYQAKEKKHDVEVILDVDEDSDHNVNNQKLVEYLRANHVQVDVYPVDPVQFDHVKLLIVDGQEVLLGGENFSSESPANHDADLLITGPIAKEAEGIFHADQNFARGHKTGVLAQLSGMHADLGFMTTSPYAQGGGASDIRNYLVDAIERAHHEFYVEMYSLNNPAVIKAMIAARARGVDVRIMLDPSQETNRKSFRELKEGGVSVRWFLPVGHELLHAKWEEEDQQEVELGSANYTEQGLDGGGERADGSKPSKSSYHNHEVALHVKDKKVASDFRSRFLDDWEHRTSLEDEPPHPLHAVHKTRRHH